MLLYRKVAHPREGNCALRNSKMDCGTGKWVPLPGLCTAVGDCLQVYEKCNNKDYLKRCKPWELSLVSWNECTVD